MHPRSHALVDVAPDPPDDGQEDAEEDDEGDDEEDDEEEEGGPVPLASNHKAVTCASCATHRAPSCVPHNVTVRPSFL